MQPIAYARSKNIAPTEMPLTLQPTIEQPMLPMTWAGTTANPNPELTSFSSFPRLYALPRMDHWWRAGRHTISLTQ